MNANLWAAVLVAGIIVNGIWYFIKLILQQNGYETHLFWGHWQDIINLHQLTGKEQNVEKKRQYKMLLFSFYAVILVTSAGFFLYLFYNLF